MNYHQVGWQAVMTLTPSPFSPSASLLSLLLFALLRPHRPPHWLLQLFLVPSAFVMAIIWLNIIASEVVSIMRAFGLLLSINTGTCVVGVAGFTLNYY